MTEIKTGKSAMLELWGELLAKYGFGGLFGVVICYLLWTGQDRFYDSHKELMVTFRTESHEMRRQFDLERKHDMELRSMMREAVIENRKAILEAQKILSQNQKVIQKTLDIVSKNQQEFKKTMEIK